MLFWLMTPPIFTEWVFTMALCIDNELSFGCSCLYRQRKLSLCLVRNTGQRILANISESNYLSFVGTLYWLRGPSMSARGFHASRRLQHLEKLSLNRQKPLEWIEDDKIWSMFYNICFPSLSKDSFQYIKQCVGVWGAIYARAFHELRRWGPENVHFRKSRFWDPNINVRIFHFFWKFKELPGATFFMFWVFH